MQWKSWLTNNQSGIVQRRMFHARYTMKDRIYFQVMLSTKFTQCVKDSGAYMLRSKGKKKAKRIVQTIILGGGACSPTLAAHFISLRTILAAHIIRLRLRIHLLETKVSLHGEINLIKNLQIIDINHTIITVTIGKGVLRRPGDAERMEGD